MKRLLSLVFSESTVAVAPILAAVLTAILIIAPAGMVRAATALTANQVASGFSDPVYLTALPDDTSCLFVVEQAGRIRIIKNGTTLATPFLDITSKVTSGGERGLLGMTFHPDYATNGYFYVYYTGLDPTGKTVVERYTVSSNPDAANASSGFTIFTYSQPAANHNAGMIDFGPDGYLYVGLGDGGGAGDVDNYAQTRTSLLGKMLRLDIDGGSPYAIPADNPFVGDPNTLDEIWAIGLRNPWRWCFDRETGDMWIADVGQGNWEEVNFAPASDPGGINYGWRLKEGDHCYNPSTGCDPLDTLYDPIHEYSHSFGCSITGGFVYRGCAIPDLNGTYFFGDYCSGRVWSMRYNGSTVSDFTERTSELGVPGFGLVSFGQDAKGELYLLYSSGSIYRIEPDGVPSQCDVEPCCVGPTVGNVDGSPDDAITLGDLTVMIDILFVSFGDPICPAEANADGSLDGAISLGDLTVLIDHLFVSFEDLGPCP